MQDRYAQLERRLADSPSWQFGVGAEIIDSSFTMDVGETVVVGTSRLGGDKALIALVTAVQKDDCRIGDDAWPIAVAALLEFGRMASGAAKASKADPKPLKTPAETRRILDALFAQHPNADTELDFHNAYQLLVATILSAQCTDERVNRSRLRSSSATRTRARWRGRRPPSSSRRSSPQASSAPNPARCSAWPPKSSNSTAARCRRQCTELVKLPGVGRKTANVVLGHALGVPGLPVDRHVLRVANRIGIAQSDDPEVVEQQLGSAMPPERWTQTSDTLILHGRRICKPKPLCDRCAVRAALPLLQDRGVEVREGREAKDGSTMTREKFMRLVEEALEEIPKRFRAEIKNVAVVVEDEPPPHVLEEMEIEPGDSLFGLYQGTPLPERSWGYGNALPDRISIYQRPIEEACEDHEEIIVCVAETVIHEFGHYFGLSEEEIEEIEEKFWRGESLDDV